MGLTMATLTKKDLLEAIEDMPMDKVFNICIMGTRGKITLFGPFKYCKVADGHIVLKENK